MRIITIKAVKKLFLLLLLTGFVSLLNLNQVSASYIIQMESDADAQPGNELFSITYDSYADIITDTQSSSSFSNFNANPVFSTTGLAYDGNQYIMLMESDSDAQPGNELFFITYDSYADILTDTQSSSSFSNFNANPVFSTTGLAYDGNQYIIQMESDTDAQPGNELFSITYDSYADLLTDTQSSSSFSNFNANPVFSTTGLAYDGVKTDPEPPVGVPEPSIIALFAVGFIGIGFARRRQN